ncbi:MAG: hydrolase TatD [Geobacteraceae bacterium GWC2_58_44]|nr:MAG: hydrolase TatD [Geobacteraceae bacterium GWC2_58_44]HBG07571.1 TatD family deoxyribonuclease [Geobacter sp.]
MFFDSHCHLDDPRLRPRLPELLSDAETAGVAGFLVPGVHPDGWPGIAEISRAFPRVLPAFGVHPMHAALLTPAVESKLRRLSRSATAIGEIGLDYALATPCRDLQQRAFRTQLKIAAEAGLPVLIHCRKAFGDLLAILKEERVGRIGGVMHAFSGSPETARDCVRLGLHLSLAGSVTYPNAVRPPAVAASVALERLLLETDAPDLAPEPYRGMVNLPAYLLATAGRVAAIRGLPLDELARVTTANAARLFTRRWSPPPEGEG